MLQRFPIPLAQVKVGSFSEKLLNGIFQIIFEAMNEVKEPETKYLLSLRKFSFQFF